MKKIAPVLLIVGICLAFFYKTFTKELLPVPADTLMGMYHPWLDQAATTNPAGVPFKNFLITDPIRQQIPWRKLVVDSLKKGEIPVWNPYNFSGTPLLSNIQAGLWYPLNIFFFFLPFFVAWTVLIVVQPILAAIFLYVYLRSKRVVPPVAVFGGVVWAFCGFSIAWLTWGTIAQTALWLPLILLATDKLSENGSKYWAIVFVLSFAFALFAGHAQVALYIFIFAAVYGMWKVSWRIAGAAVGAIVVSSIQWVPIFGFFAHTSRFIDSAAWLKEGWFLPWQNLIQFITPDFFGNPATLNYWGIWNYGEFIGYIGILPLVFALYGAIFRRDRLTRFFAVSAGVVFLFLLPTPIARLPYQFHLFVFSSLQPTRLMVLVDFCLAILAALGLDAYLRKSDKKIMYIVAAIAIALGSLWIYVIRIHLDVSKHNLVLPSILLGITIGILFLRRWKSLMLVAVIGLTVFDLFRFGWKFTPFTPVKYFFPITNAISFLQSQQKPFRVMSLDNRIMPPNVGAYYGIESVEGYDPLYGARYEEFIAALNRREPNITPPFGFNRIITVPTIDSPLFPLLNVTYILTLEDIKSPELELMYREGSTRIYFYKKALPRIYPVESVVHASSKQQVISLLYDNAFNPRKTAVIEDAIALPAQPFSDNDGVRITSYADSFLVATSTLKEDHFVVISDMYDAHWRATVDGASVQTYRTDYLFIGIRVPKGDHVIKLAL